MNDDDTGLSLDANTDLNPASGPNCTAHFTLSFPNGTATSSRPTPVDQTTGIAHTPPMFRLVATLLIKLFGYRVEGAFPPIPSYVIVFGNHSTHWDTFWTLCVTRYAKFGNRVSWIYAEKLERGWSRCLIAPWLRFFGGLAVDRSMSGQNRVDHIAHEITRGTHPIFGIAPEGKRRWTPHWKSGFYHIARKACVPLVLLLVDYRERVIHVGPRVDLTGDVGRDMDQLRAHYPQFMAKFPDKVDPIRIREEGDTEANETKGEK
jgi:1-acyl-sn-glycerol-3-phosphate acyltransferase